MNRTGRPLPLAGIGQYAKFGQHTRVTFPANLGDASGVIDVPRNGNDQSHYGMVYIRFPAGVDADGYTKYTQAVAARLETYAVYKPNMPLRVRFDATNNEFVVVQIDHVRARQSGYNTHATNPNHPARNRIHLRQIVEGNVFATATTNTNSTTVSVEPIILYFDGALYNGGQANDIELSSYIPTAGNERLVLVGEDVTDRSIQIISGSTRTITATKYGLSDVDTLAQQLHDYVVPLRAVRLANNASTARENDLHVDVRQFMNVPQPHGWPKNITRHRRILNNYQQVMKGQQQISGSGELQIDGELCIL